MANCENKNEKENISGKKHLDLHTQVKDEKRGFCFNVKLNL